MRGYGFSATANSLWDVKAEAPFSMHEARSGNALRSSCSGIGPATFDELEIACFPGQDMKRVYSAIGPRLFEAAIARSCRDTHAWKICRRPSAR